MPSYKLDGVYISNVPQVKIKEEDWKYYFNGYHIASIDGDYDDHFLKGMIEEILQTYLILQTRATQQKERM